MRRRLAVIFLLAAFSAHAGDSLRVGDRVLTTGDSAARVLLFMGEPAIRAFQQFQAGALPRNQLAAGEDWQYLQDRKTIVITIVGGRVSNIATLYE